MFEIHPERTKAQQAMAMDISVVRSSGAYHFDAFGRKYLDFVAQCGAVPFGHNPEFLVQAMRDYLGAEKPNFTAPLPNPSPGRLGELLCQHAHGDFDRCVFANSGAEATEAAIKLARAKTRRAGIVSTLNGFHGKTYGAVCATGTDAYRKPFLIQNPDFAHVSFDNIDELESELTTGRHGAFIVEPVQGEGGMVTPSLSYLREAKKLCEKHGVLLILDEVQTGLGRLGTFTAAELFDVKADILLLGKALGGGMVPIAACLTTRDVWTREFELAHSSTFAGGGLCTAVGQRVVEALLFDDKRLLREVQQRSEELRLGLQAVVEQYPNAFQATSGLGLMRALKLREQRDRRGALLNYLGTPILSSYLLNKHGIATFLALNRKDVLRVEPPLTVERGQIEEFLVGVRDVAALLEGKAFDQLLSYLKR